MTEAFLGMEIDMALEDIDNAFHTDPPAVPVRSRTHEHRVLLFSMLARLRSALCYFIQSFQEGSPYICAALLLGNSEAAAETILNTPPCMRDAFVQHLVDTFPSIESLSSQESRALVHCALDMLEMDVASIECRHAAVRHLLDQKSASWDAVLQAVSADFLLRQTTLQNKEYLNQLAGTKLFADVQKYPLQNPELQSRRKKKQQPTVVNRGGGPQRAYFHHRMRELSNGRRLLPGALGRLYSRLHAEYKALSAEERAYYVQLGKAAVISGRAGQKRFINKARPSANRPVLDVVSHTAGTELVSQADAVVRESKQQAQVVSQKASKEAEEAQALVRQTRQSLMASVQPPAVAQMPCSQLVPDIRQTEVKQFHWCNPCSDFAKARGSW